MNDAAFAPTARTRLRRLPERGRFQREEVYAILDAAFLCHVGFVAEGAPVVIPTGYGRRGDTLYFHGSSASRMLRTAATGVDVCLTVTLLDGLVLARSGFHHSMNYRSVVCFGQAGLVEGEAEKIEALEVISEQIIRGRWREVRPPTAQELKATTVLSLPLREVSAKVRTGPPKDEEADYALPIWAGVLPTCVRFGEPEADPRLATDVAVPECVHARRR